MKRYKGNEFQIFSEVPFKNFRFSKLRSILSQIRINFLMVAFSILVINIGFTLSAAAQEDSEEAIVEEAFKIVKPEQNC